MSLVGIVLDGEWSRRFFTRACKNFENVGTEHYVGECTLHTLMMYALFLCRLIDVLRGKGVAL